MFRLCEGRIDRVRRVKGEQAFRRVRRIPLLVLASAVSLLAGARSLAAQPQAGNEGGLLLIDPAGRRGEAPLLETDVYIWVTGVIARAQVTQRFRNPTSEWVEGVYLLPLPETASVDTLRMLIGSRVVEGEIFERGKARRVYDRAKQTGRKASLIEQRRPNVFQTSVANIGPDETVEITVEYQDTVHYDSGELRLRFPMVVASRYNPPVDAGDPSQPWTADESDEPFCVVTNTSTEPINPVTLTVELEAGFPLRALYSPSHRIETAEVDDATIVTLDEGATPADRDFVLAWAPDVGARPKAAIFAEDVGDETFVLLMVLPPDEQPAREERLPREVVFVIDTSGSMAGASIEQAKLALLMALDRLREGDRFNVVEFNTNAIRLFPGSVPASVETIDKARAFVDSMRPDGGTNIWDALVQALDGEAMAGAIRQVVFITDGAVGNENQLFGYIESHLGDSRLFTVGIGSAPNSHFMRKAAHFGRGTFTYVGSTLEVSEQMEKLFRKLESPALADIDVWWEDGAAESYPKRMPDLYAGEPLVMTALLPNGPDGVELTGYRGVSAWETSLSVSGEKRPPCSLPFARGNEGADLLSSAQGGSTGDERENVCSPSLQRRGLGGGSHTPVCVAAQPTHNFLDGSSIPTTSTLGIAKLWARRKIESITDSLIEGVDAQTVRAGVVALGLEHHLVTQYTSLVAVDVTPTSPVGGGETRNVPVNRPHGSTTTLPRTATPATLHATIALLLLAAALVLRKGLSPRGTVPVLPHGQR